MFKAICYDCHFTTFLVTQTPSPSMSTFRDISVLAEAICFSDRNSKVECLEEFCCYLLKHEPNQHSGPFIKPKRFLIRIALGKIICILLTLSDF